MSRRAMSRHATGRHAMNLDAIRAISRFGAGGNAMRRYAVRATGRPSGPTGTEAAPSVDLALAVAPNPAAGTASVRFVLPQASAVAVDVFPVLRDRHRRART